MNILVKVKSLSRVRLFATPWTVAYHAPPSMGFSRQEYRHGLPFSSPGYLPNPGIEPGSPALEADALTSEPPGKPLNILLYDIIIYIYNVSLKLILLVFFCYCQMLLSGLKIGPIKFLFLMLFLANILQNVPCTFKKFILKHLCIFFIWVCNYL